MDMSSLKEPVAGEDRVKELRAFDETKAGVKGLVDSGIRKVPRIFIRPADELAEELNHNQSDQKIPVVDLAGIGESHERRKEVVGEVRRASREFGVFLVVNHGIGMDVLEGMVDGVRRFHEQEREEKMKFHSGDFMQQKVVFTSNVDLYHSRAANWKDSLSISLLTSDRLQPHDLPEICRNSTIEYVDEVTKLGETLFELLSEALGLKPEHLGETLECSRDRTFIGHYYPACPEPELTIGASKHTDPSFITVLLQDQVGGLQVLHNHHYINVDPLPGSFVVNIGDMLQILTNDEFISPTHRVVAKRVGPRISVAAFFSGEAQSEKMYGPIRELISGSNGARYKEFTVREYKSNFFGRPIYKSGLDEFKLHLQDDDADNVQS